MYRKLLSNENPFRVPYPETEDKIKKEKEKYFEYVIEKYNVKREGIVLEKSRERQN